MDFCILYVLHSLLSSFFAFSDSLFPLRSRFPLMETQLLERAQDGCGNDLDAAIESLLALSLEDKSEGFSVESDASSEKEKLSSCGDMAGWVELLVRELQSATSGDDARARASSLLQMHEESIRQQEAAQIEVVIRENALLKRAVAVQHQRQKEFIEDRNREVQHLKPLLSQYQEQLRTLKVNNYGLTMHLRQAQKNNPIIGCFNPDVF